MKEIGYQVPEVITPHVLRMSSGDTTGKVNLGNGIFRLTKRTVAPQFDLYVYKIVFYRILTLDPTTPTVISNPRVEVSVLFTPKFDSSINPLMVDLTYSPMLAINLPAIAILRARTVIDLTVTYEDLPNQVGNAPPDIDLCEVAMVGFIEQGVRGG